jgi:hypothetical protein
LEDETQGSSSEPKEIAKGSEASSESKETPPTLSAEKIAEELHREKMDRGVEGFAKAKAKLIASGEWASGLAKFNESDHDWASLGATFDRAAKVPGSYQRIFDGAPDEVTRESSPLLTHVRDKFKRAKPTDVPRIPLDQRLVDPSLTAEGRSLTNDLLDPETAPSTAETAKPNSSNEDAEMQGEGNQETASAPKDPARESSAQSTEYETLFIDRLVRLASIGDLSTRDEVLDVYLAAFGDHPEVSEDFVYNLTMRLANLPETPFETIIKDYQEKQDELIYGRTKIVGFALIYR